MFVILLRTPIGQFMIGFFGRVWIQRGSVSCCRHRRRWLLSSSTFTGPVHDCLCVCRIWSAIFFVFTAHFNLPIRLIATDWDRQTAHSPAAALLCVLFE